MIYFKIVIQFKNKKEKNKKRDKQLRKINIEINRDRRDILVFLAGYQLKLN